MKLALQELIEAETTQFVTSLYNKYTLPYLVYHNLDHTRLVVQRTLEIVAYYNLDDDKRFILYVAGWFHDTGHLFVDPQQHEEKSVQLARDFLHNYSEVPEQLISRVEQCIRATKMPQRPRALIEKILCDADLYHLGTDEFSRIDNLVKQENLLRGNNIENWTASSLELLKTHTFHTAYCQKKLTKGKQNNIALLTGLSD